MKHLFSSLVLLLFTFTLWAQAPQAINYQGVARNTSGVAYAGQQINVRLSIHTGIPEGNIEYSETRSITTNQFGLFNVQIGSAGASAIQGNFATINWAVGAKFLQTEISVNGQPYSNLGTTQMMSVPFAISSRQSKQLVFPFDTTVNIDNTNVFNIKNISASALSVLNAESYSGTAITGTSDKKPGIAGFSNNTKVGAVTGANPTLGGYGVHGYTSAANYSGAGVYGQALTGSGVRGETEKGSGVLGVATGFGSGLNGQALSNGNGVLALTYTGFGLYAVAMDSTGTAGKFINNNANGKALDVDGKIKIHGGNTNPAAGKVLTSDASGNATWQYQQTIAFRASGMRDNVKQAIAPYTSKKVLFYQQARYNIGNAYDAENSIFFPPFAGVYHFNVQLGWFESSEFSHIELKLLRNGQITTIAEEYNGVDHTEIINVYSGLSLVLDIALQANDAVWVEVSQAPYESKTISLVPEGYKTWFTGHLITRL